MPFWRRSLSSPPLMSAAPAPPSRLYVGGLAPSTSEHTLRAAFIPFGLIETVSMPLNYETGQTKGFAFVQYADADDCADAVANMHMNEIDGKTIRVTYATDEQSA